MWHHDCLLHLHVDNKRKSLCCVGEARCGIMTVSCTCIFTKREGAFVVLRQDVIS